MAVAGDLLNKGFILNNGSAEKGRTFIVTGLQRSGTSLVGSLLQQAGLFIGSEINDFVFEDEAIARALDARNIPALQQIIADRNANHASWGFKFPMLCSALDAGQLSLFERPRLIVTFRDPVAMAVRRSVSEYQDPMQALRDVGADQTAMMAFVQQVACPNLLLSYEKALTFPREFADTIMRFCGIQPDATLLARLIALIEPNRQRYIGGARRRYEGLIEGVRGAHLYGWCRLTQSTEPVALEVLVDEKVRVTFVADAFRQDLLDAGIGNGRHGFFVPVDTLHATAGSVIRVRVARHMIELDNSGKRLSEFGTAA